jgi:hypothetical protein
LETQRRREALRLATEKEIARCLERGQAFAGVRSLSLKTSGRLKSTRHSVPYEIAAFGTKRLLAHTLGFADLAYELRTSVNFARLDVSSVWNAPNAVAYFRQISLEFDTITFSESQPFTFESAPWPTLLYPGMLSLDDIDWNMIEPFFQAAKKTLFIGHLQEFDRKES